MMEVDRRAGAYPQYCGLWRTLRATAVQYSVQPQYSEDVSPVQYSAGQGGYSDQCRGQAGAGQARPLHHRAWQPVKTAENLWAVPDIR